jgi:rifampin ADP-ribosylating transferase
MTEVLDEGPFFHGTIADLRVGDLLTAGYRSNYRPEVVMNHIYFTANVDGAGLAAEIAAELTKGGAVPRVYVVEPTGIFENDPNVTDKKFPGNPTRSYRSSAPLSTLNWTARSRTQNGSFEQVSQAGFINCRSVKAQRAYGPLARQAFV